MLRYKPKNSHVDPDNPRAWGRCDRCGFIWCLHDLAWQYEYRGSFNLQNIRVLVCPPCYDAPQEQLRAYVLPPDPPMVFNVRPEAYVLDETSWLVTTEGAEIIDTQDGEEFITSLPNPSSSPDVCVLTASLSGASVAVAYLDLFDGDPLGGGVSILSAREDIAVDLTTTDGVATNLEVLGISNLASAQANVNYIGIYDASTSGILLMSGPVAATFPTIIPGAAVQFDPLGLTITIV